MSQPNRLAADAAHQFGGIELDRGRPLGFRIDGRRIVGFAGDTVLSAVLAAGIDTYGLFRGAPIGLDERFCPLVASRRDAAEPMATLPMDRLPAAEGLDLVTLGRRTGFDISQVMRPSPRSLRHLLDDLPDPPWLRAKPEATLAAELLIVGGGVAGLASADSAAAAGRTVIVVERRPWLGGDSRYFGAVGDEESPEALTTRLIARLATRPNVTILGRAEAFAMRGATILVHHIETGETTRGRVLAIAASRVLLSTGSRQRIQAFAGNRLPGVTSSVAAYHLAKRYGVTGARNAVVATQGNFGYRLALRLSDAGVAVQRVVDPRVNAQSRFIDFCKAGGLTLASGQFPLSAAASRRSLLLAFANTGSNGPAASLEAGQLIIAGGFQPDLALWMLAGGGVRWTDGRFEASGQLDNLALAGAAAGCRSLRACAESGRAAVAGLFGDARPAGTDGDDIEIGSHFETPDAGAVLGPFVAGAPSFLDSGASLVLRPSPAQHDAPVVTAHALSLGDVAASVELGLIAAADGGAVAEERGAPGVDLVASDWLPGPKPRSEGLPAYLGARFGSDPVHRHLIVDDKRRFEIGALVYANISRPRPELAIGVIVAPAPDGQAGGIALLSRTARGDRFIVETLTGPSPARPAKS